jgi:prepilin-type N-terminal cleavage/methylation domain-containing protein
VQKSGFTLIELSIVIVIIGLIVAGVVGGQTLVQQAKYRAVGAEADQLLGAIYTFRSQYGTIPGDLSNATSYWSGTANGNGDREITVSTQEMYVNMNHLSLAGLTGQTILYEASKIKPGIGKYQGAISGSGYHMTNTQNIGLGSNTQNHLRGQFYKTGEKHYLMFGVKPNDSSTDANGLNGGVFTPAEAKSIDLKFDDGEAGSGYMRAGDGYNGLGGSHYTACISNQAGGYAYILSTTSKLCAIGFWR